MDLNCKNCKTKIEPHNINIATDLTKCENCGSIDKASELLLNSEIRIDLKPLNGSKVVVHQGANDKIEFIYPKKGYSIKVLPQLIFVLFWLSFISFWTWGASQSSILFGLFSLPFWLFGFGMVIGIINAANESQIIMVDRFNLEIKKLKPIMPRIIKTNLRDIQSVKMKRFKLNEFSILEGFSDLTKVQNSYGMELPAIITGHNTEYFFEDANDAEQEWITKILGNIIRKKAL